MVMPVLALACGSLFLIGLVAGVMGVDDFGSAMLVGSAIILLFALPVLSESIVQHGLVNSLVGGRSQTINLIAVVNVAVAVFGLLRVLGRFGRSSSL